MAARVHIFLTIVLLINTMLQAHRIRCCTERWMHQLMTACFFPYGINAKVKKTQRHYYDYGKIVYSLDSITFHQLNGTVDLVDSSNMTYLFATHSLFSMEPKILYRVLLGK